MNIEQYIKKMSKYPLNFNLAISVYTLQLLMQHCHLEQRRMNYS